MSQVTAGDPLRVLGTAAARLKGESLPEEVRMRARQRVLDTLACLVAGYDAGISSIILDYVTSQGGAPEATLLPLGTKTTAALAGLAHSTLIFGLELSDAAPRGTVHPGCEIVSSALAIAERRGLGGADILPALVAGYELEIRFGRALHPGAFYRGWSTVGILGAIGPAATAAHLMGGSAAQIDSALGIVVNLAPAATGRASDSANVGSAKWLVGGQACTTGILAAEMAMRGVTGMRKVVDTWLKVLSDDVHAERLTEGIEADGTFSQWELTSGVVTKYHATVGPLVSALEATAKLVAEYDIKPEDVVSITADCMRRTAIFKTAHPDNEITARASLPYCMAVIICTRDEGQLLGPAYKPAMLNNPDVAAIADKITITQNEEYERLYPARSLASVTVELKDGRTVSAEVDRSEISRYLTPTDAEIAAKFSLVATPILGEAKTRRIIDRVLDFENVTQLGELIADLTPDAEWLHARGR